jgi:voltage-gated potassium channel
MFPFLLTVQSFVRAVRTAWRNPEFRSLAVIVATLLATGTVFYRQIEGWSWVDSFYFCVITLATVGYGDFSPQTVAGKIFTILYIFLGIGLLVALFTQLAEALLAARRQERSSSE